MILLAIVALITTGPSTNLVGGKTKAPAAQTGDGGEVAGGGEPAPQGPGAETPAPITETTQAAAPPGRPAPEPEGDTRATRPGTYRYHSKWTSTGGSQGPQQQESDISSRVATTSETPQEVRQTLEFEGYLFEVVWRSDSITVPKTTIGGAECNWEPDLLQAALPIRKGGSWTTDTSCTASYQGQQARTEFHQDSRVTGTEQIQIAGATLDAFVIERTSVVNTTFGVNTYKQEKTTKEWWSVKHAITLRSSEREKVTTTEGQYDTTTELELLNIAPE